MLIFSKKVFVFTISLSTNPSLLFIHLSPFCLPTLLSIFLLSPSRTFGLLSAYYFYLLPLSPFSPLRPCYFFINSSYPNVAEREQSHHNTLCPNALLLDSTFIPRLSPNPLSLLTKAPPYFPKKELFKIKIRIDTLRRRKVSTPKSTKIFKPCKKSIFFFRLYEPNTIYFSKNISASITFSPQKFI